VWGNAEERRRRSQKKTVESKLPEGRKNASGRVHPGVENKVSGTSFKKRGRLPPRNAERVCRKKRKVQRRYKGPKVVER